MATVYVRVRPRLRDGALTTGTKESASYAHLLGRRLGHVWQAVELDAKTLRLVQTIGVLEVSMSEPKHMARGRMVRGCRLVIGDAIDLPPRKAVVT